MYSERCNSSKSCIIRSSQVSLGLPLLLLPSTQRASTALTGAVTSLLFTCSNHLNLPSLILLDILATPSLSLKTLFLIRFILILVCPHIHRSILISATSILRVCVFLIAQQSVLYNIVGLTATL
ncbi:hypothetical protein Hanom_Chr09g00784381 [Helianthus anomalus]